MIWDAIRRFLQIRLALVGLVLASFIVVLAVVGPVIVPYHPDEMHPLSRLTPPCRLFLLGTDNFGRDLLSRVAFGARISLRVGLMSVIVAASGGTILGLLAGYFGGLLDGLLTQLMEVLLSFPSLLLALAIMAVLGSNLSNLILAISLVSIPVFARLVRGEVLLLRERLFVEAARSIGASPLHIIRRHMVPNVLPMIIIQMTMRLSSAILVESSLSYLGYGTRPPTASWGRMLSEGRAFFGMAPWMAIWPGLFVMISQIGFNLLGDGLRDALDPYLKGR
ncbi:MAG: ABC transporter permease [Chloroflexi bacterium]|nr:ABC transporter permease [Chloroflexota bacterium]